MLFFNKLEMEMMSILLITTGGTIGALPYEDPTNPPQFATMPPEGTDLVREAVSLAYPQHKVRCISMPLLDSKKIDEAYRKNIWKHVKHATENLILITHGTDTIIDTAAFLHAKSLHGKKILLTGAMTPISNGPDSDGYKNLGHSLDRLANHRTRLSRIGIVLCESDSNGLWNARVYKFKPGRYIKLYEDDGRYHHLLKTPQTPGQP